jgi:alpha-beta hydrolase superfamily lysophospholipase
MGGPWGAKIRPGLPIYLFSGSEDPVGQQLEGVRNLSCDSYKGGHHEMLNELNRGEVRTNLLAWLSAVLGNQSPHKEPL